MITVKLYDLEKNYLRSTKIPDISAMSPKPDVIQNGNKYFQWNEVTEKYEEAILYNCQESFIE